MMACQDTIPISDPVCMPLCPHIPSTLSFHIEGGLCQVHVGGRHRVPCPMSGTQSLPHCPKIFQPLFWDLLKFKHRLHQFHCTKDDVFLQNVCMSHYSRYGFSLSRLDAQIYLGMGL